MKELDRIEPFTSNCIQSMKWELVYILPLHEAFETGNYSAANEMGYNEPESFMYMIMRLTGFMHRQLLVVRSFRTRIIEAEEKWANSGEPWPPPDPIGSEERKTSIIANTVDPGYETYIRKTYIADQRLAAYKAAVQAELKRRQTNDKKPIEIDFPGFANGPAGKIVIDNDKGCIILDKQEKKK